MTALELKIPPPAVAAVTAAAMWLLSVVTPTIPVPASVRIAVATVVSLAGGVFAVAALLAFRRARTTVSPHKPDKSSALVTSGVYRITRNPMYVGLVLVLLAWAAFLAAPLALVGPLAFVAYMNRFQIQPEERILAAMFGDPFVAYMASVRRWL